MLFIELSLELYYQSWYIGAMVGVAACHDVEQGSNQHAVNYKIKKFVCHEMDDTQESCGCAAWTFALHFSFQHQLTDQPPGM